jgi:hypothetical protein
MTVTAWMDQRQSYYHQRHHHQLHQNDSHHNHYNHHSHHSVDSAHNGYNNHHQHQYGHRYDRPHPHQFHPPHISGPFHGQISPVSADLPEMTLERLPLTTSFVAHSDTSSSCTTDSSSAWSQDGDTIPDDEMDDGLDHAQDMSWEQDSGQILAVPKLEPVDDDNMLEHIQDMPTRVDSDYNNILRTVLPDQTASTDAAAPEAPVKFKRPRGRPRKYPLNTIVNTAKVAKGRTKTGCITCRRRKKKCDEAKPRCE